MGFEPMELLHSLVFKTSSINRSDTLPQDQLPRKTGRAEASHRPSVLTCFLTSHTLHITTIVDVRTLSEVFSGAGGGN